MERDDDPIRILRDGEEKAIFLPGGDCYINASTSEYLDFGKWRPVDDMSALNKLSLHKGSTDSYSLKVGGSNFSTFLNGRVIKLGLTCLPPVGKPCLLFKLRGSERCSFFETHSTPTQAVYASPFKPPETHDDLLPVEFYLYTPTQSVSPTSIVSAVAKEKHSFKPSQTIPLSAIPALEEVAPLSVNGMPLITSFRKTVLSPKLTSHTVDFSSSPFVDERVESRRMISISKTETIKMISAPKSIFDASDSTGMNGVPILRSKKKKKSTPSHRSRTIDSIIVTAVIPGTLAGLFVILVSVLLLFLARRMGHLVRVAAERDENAEEEVQPSISEVSWLCLKVFSIYWLPIKNFHCFSDSGTCTMLVRLLLSYLLLLLFIFIFYQVFKLTLAKDPLTDPL
ncbi:uncharacterized protein LOC111340999 isoform X1 [Stylophora pistillata]|uniref:uncharacterized protein LOC111340999 isoform X1 n=1 Tax=Stylophora pistillata TaxID=50429 RepID=UPI000C056AD6|nr:uncharacterized protein LOC111340999 isoform X1 [Stylophora pistillata]